MNPSAALEHERRQRRDRIHALINAERARQNRKFGWPQPCVTEGNEHVWSSILAEEVGEVTHALLEGDTKNLEEELVQVAAVCVAWLESRWEFGT